eukprot:12415922-Alexandrium_andersonii.AAC.1
MKRRNSASSSSRTCARGHSPSGAWRSPTKCIRQTSSRRWRNSSTEKASASARSSARCTSRAG